jgi:hypothetical protein
MVVQEYYEPPAPRWEYYGRRRYGVSDERSMDKSEEFPGDDPHFVIAASFPAHSKMKQVWSYAVLDPEGNVIDEKLTNLLGGVLMHPSDFGIDVEDASTAEREMDEIAEAIMSNWSQFKEGLLSCDKLIERDSGCDADVE